MKNRRSAAEGGFTIIELMIALTVLSTLLLLSTMILIQIGATYSKGVNTSNLQNATRNVSSEIVSTLQFSGTPPAGCNSHERPDTCIMGKIRGSVGDYDIYAYCINTTRYSYVMNRELGTDNDPTVSDADRKVTPHVMWRDTMRSAYLPCKPLDISVDKVLSDSNSVEGFGPDVYSKGHEMVPNRTRLTRFLVSSPSSDTANVYKLSLVMAYGDSDLVNVDSQGFATCNGGKGTEYCAVSQMSSTVIRRVGN